MPKKNTDGHLDIKDDKTGETLPLDFIEPERLKTGFVWSANEFPTEPLTLLAAGHYGGVS